MRNPLRRGMFTPPAWWRLPHTGVLSIFDPIHLGRDELGEVITLRLPYRNLIVGGEPGAGKSNALHLIVGHAALCDDITRIVLFDGKKVELALARPVADEFVGPQPDHAIAALDGLRLDMEEGYDELEAAGQRRVARGNLTPGLPRNGA